MKKIVLTFGLISGVVMAAATLLTFPLHDTFGFDRGLVIGYTIMLVAFLLIFFGIRSYRDNVAGGTVRFGRAFTVGILIGAVASVLYVAAWEVYYFTVEPDFMADYQEHVLHEARADGETAEQIAERQRDMDRWAELYQNPAVNAAVTFAEPFPVALVVSLVSAGVLSRRRRTLVGQRDGFPTPPASAAF